MIMKRDYNRIDSFVLLDDGSYKAINCNCDIIYSKWGDNSSHLEEFNYYNDNGREVHSITKTTFGGETDIIEVWKDYDENGNLILYKDTEDTWIEFKYDDQNNMIYFKDHINLRESWHRYDDKNRLIYRKDSDGKVQQWEYNPLCTHYKDNTGYETWITYNKYGKPIRFENNKGYDSLSNKNGTIGFNNICETSICDTYHTLFPKTKIE